MAVNRTPVGEGRLAFGTERPRHAKARGCLRWSSACRLVLILVLPDRCVRALWECQMSKKNARVARGFGASMHWDQLTALSLIFRLHGAAHVGLTC